MTAPTLDAIAAKLTAGTPLDRADYLALSATTDLVQLGMLASDARRRRCRIQSRNGRSRTLSSAGYRRR